jgi:hypothetical protein
MPVVEQDGDLTSNPLIERTGHSPKNAFPRVASTHALGRAGSQPARGSTM